jgi:hypothetical protein
MTQLATLNDLTRRLANEASLPEERRALLAFWASDIHAVRDCPALRQLDDGTVFHVDDIFDAMKSLDCGGVEPRYRTLEMRPHAAANGYEPAG